MNWSLGSRRRSGEPRAAVGLLIGRGNAGKTLLLLNFLDFLGAHPLVLHRQRGTGTERLVYTRREAEGQLVSAVAASTAAFCVGMVPTGPGRPGGLALVDAPPVDPDGEQFGPPAVRRASGLVDILLHVVDAAEVGVGQLDPLDRRLLTGWGRRPGYLLLANKVDRPWGAAGMNRLATMSGGEQVVPISARTGRGFRELRSRLFLALTEVKRSESFPN